MNMKTLLLYAAIACGGIGASAVILPYLTSSDDVPQAQQESAHPAQGPPAHHNKGTGVLRNESFVSFVFDRAGHSFIDQ